MLCRCIAKDSLVKRCGDRLPSGSQTAASRRAPILSGRADASMHTLQRARRRRRRARQLHS
eukprot:6177644-Pleurochrysis_carterae.AAC.2